MSLDTRCWHCACNLQLQKAHVDRRPAPTPAAKHRRRVRIKIVGTPHACRVRPVTLSDPGITQFQPSDSESKPASVGAALQAKRGTSVDTTTDTMSRSPGGLSAVDSGEAVDLAGTSALAGGAAMCAGLTAGSGAAGASAGAAGSCELAATCALCVFSLAPQSNKRGGMCSDFMLRAMP